MNELSLTAIVLTRDESPHIRRCLESLLPVAQRICVVDSGSIDDTLDIARSIGADVFTNPWINHAAQFNWALDHCLLTTDWVLRLDADEFLEPALQTELTQRLPRLPMHVHGILLKRKYFFLGRWIRFGGLYPVFHLRVWRNGSARIEPRWMDEHPVLRSGSIVRLEGALVDDNTNDVGWWSQKHIGYAEREAVQVLIEDVESIVGTATAPKPAGRQAFLKRWAKQHVYNRLPLGVGPLLYVFYRLFVRLGILDGPKGIAFHILQGFWYRLLVDLRRYELGEAVKGFATVDEKLAALQQATGLNIMDFRDKHAAGRP